MLNVWEKIKNKSLKKKSSKKKKKKKKSGMRTYDRSSEENHWQGAKTRLRLLITFQERGTLLFQCFKKLQKKHT